MLFLFLTLSFVLAVQVASSQIYGLKFQKREVALDQRTKLDISPNGFLNLENEFEISFDYRLESNNINTAFGYVFRIINSDNINVDLLSTPTPFVRLNVVIGKTNSFFPINYPENTNKKWINLRIKFIPIEDRLIFYTPDSSYVQNNIGFKKRDSYKIIFGANDYQEFETTDVPSMSIRNLIIIEQGLKKCEWLLDESEGTIATDRIKNRKAYVKNPSWLMKEHKVWDALFEQEIDGNLLVAFDDKNVRIFMIANDKYYVYSLASNNVRQYKYKNKPLFLSRGHRVIYNSLDNKICCYLVDGGPCYNLNIETHEWDSTGFISDYSTKYQLHNSFYNTSDNSIYLFGGYGRHSYNNEVRKIDLNQNTWTDLPSNDSIFYPRYMAGLGVLNDTAYILGGFGSVTGNQIINPHSYSDLLAYSINDSSWSRKYEFPQIVDNMLVGNSMMIDENTRNYYALVFDKKMSNGNIQLICGNLDVPKVEFVGNTIPFSFYDIKSFTSLFYMRNPEKLIAYTSYFNEFSKTQVKILSLNYPPNKLEGESIGTQKAKSNAFQYFIFAFIALSVLVVWFLRRRKKGTSVNSKIEAIEDKIPIMVPVRQKMSDVESSYQITFFGGFQVFGKDTEDITGKFSKLLKELFLLILLHTFKNNKGISVEKITEVLWHDKTVQSARNNRAVNIKKLRTLIEKIGACELSNETGYWKIILNEPKIKCDYIDFLKLTESKSNLTKLKVNQLLNIVQKGAFLGNVHYDWLDEFKANVSDTIINTLVDFASTCDIKKEADFIIHLADSIFNFDIINEDALILKCKAHHSMGKYSHAKVTFDKFFKEYQVMYDQEYEKSFVEILKINKQ